MSDITRIINKYYTKDGKNMTATPKRNPYEQTGKDYDKQRKQEYNLQLRQAILSQLIRESPFHLTPSQENQIRYWIQQFNKNFKDFHRQASNETIILAFIMIQRKNVIPNTKVYKFKICEKYNLTTPIFELIQNRLIFKLMQTTPLQYNQKIILDNSIEDKKGK